MDWTQSESTLLADVFWAKTLLAGPIRENNMMRLIMRSFPVLFPKSNERGENYPGSSCARKAIVAGSPSQQ